MHWTAMNQEKWGWGRGGDLNIHFALYKPVVGKLCQCGIVQIPTLTSISPAKDRTKREMDRHINDYELQLFPTAALCMDYM